jgi:hypothetical protein
MLNSNLLEKIQKKFTKKSFRPKTFSLANESKKINFSVTF